MAGIKGIGATQFTDMLCALPLMAVVGGGWAMHLGETERVMDRDDTEPIKIFDRMVLGEGLAWNGSGNFTKAHRFSSTSESYLQTMSFDVVCDKQACIYRVKKEYSFSAPRAVSPARGCQAGSCEFRGVARLTVGFGISTSPRLTYGEETAILKMVAEHLRQPLKHVTLEHPIRLPFRGPAAKQAWFRYLVCTVHGRFSVARTPPVFGAFAVVVPVTKRGSLDLVLGLQPATPEPAEVDFPEIYDQ